MVSTITTFSHLQIPLEDVLKATNNFDAKNIIGYGGLGKVYKGKLLRSGKWMNIAARRLDTKHKQDIEFWTEISALSTLKHENLVSIIGFCDEKGQKVIINNHEAKRSLLMYLSNPCLTWIQRMRICVGVARALSYIHYEDGRSYSVIHRNINSSTILLDDNFEPKLSGFEYSINQSVHRMDQVLFSEAIGTTGYMDPSIEKSGGVTHKSDIYSFGIVLWEVLCGRKAFIPNEDNSFLAPLAIYRFENNTVYDIIQPGLRYQMGNKSLQKFSEIAYSCLNDERVLRPDMNYVVHELEEALELELPYESLFTNNLEHLKFRLGDLKIRLADIKLATDNFSEAYHMWDTTFYDLYIAELELFDKENFASVEEKSKSELPKRRTDVVIKRIRPREDKREEKVFFTEIEILTSCKHDNIVSLLGFCDEGFEKILVVEHLSNGYLEDYLENIKDMPVLAWAERLKICLDVAYGLNYLHYEMEDNKTVINRNIKSGIIVLDENWRAKIADFEFSLFLPLNQDDDALHLKLNVGAHAYTDPECMTTGKLKRESDVYSFGVVLFEVLCGRVAYDPIYEKESEKGLAVVAQRRFREGTLKEMIDPLIIEESNDNNFIITKGPNKDSLDIFVKIAYQCLTETQDQRPTMKVVIKELKKALSFQEQVQHQDIDQVVEKSLELKMAHENHGENKNAIEVQRQDINQAVYEFEKSLELKITNENLEESENACESPLWINRKGNILEHLRIRLSDIMLATYNFSEAYHMDGDSFYDIYRAELELFDKENFASVEEKGKSELPKRRTTAFIKRIRPTEDKRGEKLFFTEIEILTSCKHPNIVTLLGFCDEGYEKILVIESLSNGYLGYYLKHIGDKRILTWGKRLKICLDVAHGLKYLHYEMEDQKVVIHFNMKNTAIELDNNWGAKISELGYSMFLPPNQDEDALYPDKISRISVYRDPEYDRTGRLKRESDVYSFGVILLEILCGRLAYDPMYLEESNKGLAYLAKRWFHDGTIKEMIDPIIMEESGENTFTLNRGPNKNSLDAFLKIAFECLEETQDQRPTMKVVVKELEKALIFQENTKDGDLRISLEDIKLATQNFLDDNCIGRGGFGRVYKGKVPEGVGFSTIVAKQLDTRGGQGEIQFRNELQILFEYKHDNIISLVGYCDEKDAKIIVYEYASRGSLDRYLNDTRLTWMKRLNICIDVAAALAFLHSGVGKHATVIHRDIKAANILLTSDWNAKLADFGLSLISAMHTDYVIHHACGTPGYVDPLYLKSGFLTKESDIYSFGVVLFEILCGRSTFGIHKQEGVYLPSFIKHSFEKGKQDEVMFEEIKAQIIPEALSAFQTIAYQCLNENREERPKAKEVVEQLKKALELQMWRGAGVSTSTSTS